MSDPRSIRGRSTKMQRLTAEQRSVLTEVGEPGEFVSNDTFAWALAHGYGYWGPDDAGEVVWWVTEAGKRALAYDLMAD